MPLTLTIRGDAVLAAACAAGVVVAIRALMKRQHTSAATTKAVTTSTTASSSSSKPKARVAVVGCGGWTQNWHLPNLANRSDCEVVALVDPAASPGVAGCVPSMCTSMDALSQKYGAKVYANLEAMLSDKSLGPVDGLLCAASHAAHHEIGVLAMSKGMHVLMEKPMTTDVKEARALLELSRARPKQGFMINNTANWQPGTVAAYEAVAAGKLGELKHVSCVLAAPLGWLFEGAEHKNWTAKTGTMLGNGFGWGQFSHTFAWVYKVTGLTPKTVYASCTHSKTTGADLFDAVVVTCTNGATISASGVGSCPDTGAKVVGNWLFGSGGMLSYGGLAGSDNVENEAGMGAESAQPRGMGASRLEYWLGDGTHTVGPAFEFEHLDQGGTGPGSMDAWIAACRGEPYFDGAGALVGLKAVATIEAMYRSARSGKAEPVSDTCE